MNQTLVVAGVAALAIIVIAIGIATSGSGSGISSRLERYASGKQDSPKVSTGQGPISDLIAQSAHLVPDTSDKQTVGDLTATVTYDPTPVAGSYVHLTFHLSNAGFATKDFTTLRPSSNSVVGQRCTQQPLHTSLMTWLFHLRINLRFVLKFNNRPLESLGMTRRMQSPTPSFAAVHMTPCLGCTMKRERH